MIGSSFPIDLIEELYQKLKEEVYDSGQFFQILDNQEIESFQVRTKSGIAKEGKVFLIDHAATFRCPELRILLRENPKIVERLEYMLKYQGDKDMPEGEEKKVENSELELELDNMELADVSMI